MKIYVASHCRWAAQHWADNLTSNGHVITSHWHSKPFLKTAAHTYKERVAIAQEDIDDIMTADALVLVSGPDKYSGGKFVETGIAIGLGYQVYVIGRRENMLMYAANVHDIEELK